MGRTLRTLFCALLATAVVPSTLRAAYAEVQAVQIVEREAAPARPVEKPNRPTPKTARSSRITFRPLAARRFYVRYCRLLR